MKEEGDIRFMRLALREGRKGLGGTSPNPPVGAVVVDPKTGEIIARGYHRGAGKPHAEAEALKKAGARARGATLYVTLEPCHHYGRTPPCTEAILAAGITRVVAGTRDPNPKAGGGLEYLASQGLEVRLGVLEKECRYLARFFLKKVLTGLPWVILKAAVSLDGRIATRTGDSKWITGNKARRVGHRLRNLCDAILVGKNTVLADDPELTCRIPGGLNPVRIILDTRLSLSPEFRIFKTARKTPTWIICGKKAPLEKERVFRELGVRVLRLPEKAGKIDLRSLLEVLVGENLLSVLVEGGGEVHGSFLDEGLVDEVFFFVGPVVIGGRKAPQAVAGTGPERLSKALWLKDLEVKPLGDAVLFHGLSEQGLRILESHS